MKIQSINPHDYSVIGEVEASTEGEIVKAVKAANRAKLSWKNTKVKERVKLLRKVRQLLKSRADDIAELITQEVGTPITECKEEIDWDWGYFDWFLENADSILAPETTLEDEASIHQVWYEPIGTAAVITPWNLPFDMFVWGVIPNLLAGNTVVYKASEECILTGQLLAEIMEDSPLPKGVFNLIHGDGKQGEMLVSQDIDLIWFTGSSDVGQQLYQKAAKKFIKAILEMGGSNPTIVFADADLETATKSLMFKRFSFCGQTCDALKRLIIHEDIHDLVIEKLSRGIKAIKIGDPLDPETQMGPLAAKRQLELLDLQVKDALDKGARIITQTPIDNSLIGAYYPPTLLTNVKPNMRIWHEEVFGPVLPIITFKSEAEAIELANDTRYGLGSQVFTSDLGRALRIASHIEAGNVDINGVGHFKACNPFGGYKFSGIGREHGAHGLRELTQVKVVSRNK